MVQATKMKGWMKAGGFGFLLLAVLWLTGCAGTVYDTAGDPKAKGLRIQVNVPEGWEKDAVTNRDMLMQFVRKNETTIEMLQLHVHDVDGVEAGYFFPAGNAEPQEARHEVWKRMIGKHEGVELVSVADTMLPDGRPAVLADSRMRMNRELFTAYARMKMLYVYENEHMVVATCGNCSLDEYRGEVDRLLEDRIAPVCQAYFASLRFVE